ncbi:hypothetical protein PF001_g1487 [Phytophthora fragariae]|uniref:Uncharacterized protein n=1 Tax=Phytophthora fragariae TaxID=53985 RepID=A0A6A4F370_9STRA|nr:hypothetical protein PF003_g35019 [Phytophthora fragariae]KAE9253600.1 hypothetical protein PF004_g1449 [Phytophthora fragariae]KAE9328316.1 hypothetical protein PF001_g1487 [Phytophthora fragariae]
MPQDLDVVVREQLDVVRFRVVDPNKVSRFLGRDLFKLIQTVTRHKTYATPMTTAE